MRRALRIARIEIGWHFGSRNSRGLRDRLNGPMDTGEGFTIDAKQIFCFRCTQQTEARRKARYRQRLAVGR
jgi:hypothetical protein